MPGRSRLPSGEPRKASQRNKRSIVPPRTKVAPTWRFGDRVHWKDRFGTFRRDVADGKHVEIVIEGRVYRVRMAELK